MLTREECLPMAAHAVAQYERLRSTVSHDTEIVYVVSKDVCRAMQLEAYTSEPQGDYKFSPIGSTGTYCGARVAYIDTAESFFKPAVYTGVFKCCSGLQIGDYILLDDDTIFSASFRLFWLSKLKSDGKRVYAHRANVNFVLPYTPPEHVVERLATDYANNIIIDVTSNYHSSLYSLYDIFKHKYSDEDDLLDALSFEFAESAREKRLRKKTVREDELNPGNTELIDEYLHSFLMGGC